jgi:hypothetical protein
MAYKFLLSYQKVHHVVVANGTSYTMVSGSGLPGHIVEIASWTDAGRKVLRNHVAFRSDKRAGCPDGVIVTARPLGRKPAKWDEVKSEFSREVWGGDN